ncbi:hypothetical protein [Streptomyces sp. B21-083]|uniref:hypothetical protein n=1 Tax=Streptomyces sp. B21-083 TaxID=3039410 RepID=UPI002FF32B10
MDPISVTLLAALAGGLGGEAGRQAWQGLTALVRRPFHRGGTDGDPTVIIPAVSSGEPELTALVQAPNDTARAQALSTALAVRAVLDGEFARHLEEWSRHARQTGERDGVVHNEISGGTYHNSPVIQGRDISGVTFNAPPPHHRTSPPPPETPPQP